MQWKTEVGGEGISGSLSVLKTGSGVTGPKLFSVITENYSLFWVQN